jgi:hypothetical protein
MGLSVALLLTFQLYAAAAEDAYQEDALGTIGNPLRQELDADPSLVESLDRFEDQVESGKEKVIKVGIILLKEEKLFFSPLIQQSMAFEWWTLTGKTQELNQMLPQGVQVYCKLKGSREMTRRMHRKRESATMGFRDVYYTLMVDKILWVKSQDEILDIKRRIDNAVVAADVHYENRRFGDALPHYNEAKELAQEYLPNAISYGVIERASHCQAQVMQKK